MTRRLPRPTLGELLLLATALVVLLQACLGPRSAEPSELTEARVLVAGARLARPAARQVCQGVPEPPVCHALVDGLDDVLAVVEPQLVACPGSAADPERQACEAKRLAELRQRLPELRRLARLVAGLARGAVPTTSSSAAPSAPAASSAPERTP